MAKSSSQYTAIPLFSPANELSSRSTAGLQSKESEHESSEDNLPNFPNDRSKSSFLRKYRSRYILGIIIISIISLIIYFKSGKTSPSDQRNLIFPSSLPIRIDHEYPESSTWPTSKIGFSPSLNRTLGFGKIYVLNMPYRRDKKAEVTILAHQYGFDVEFVDGIAGQDIFPELAHDRHKQGKFGAAEAHARLWRRILKDGVRTALILEDDVDFHVDIKNQLLRIQKPLLHLITSLKGKESYSDPQDPWSSTHWDQLWLGTEVEWGWKEDKLPKGIPPPYVAFKDPTRPKLMDKDYIEVFETYGLEKHDNDSDSSERLRVFQASRNSWALSGYAMTREGAQKALYMNAHKFWVEHIDFDMMQLCRNGISREYTIVPPIFQQRKPLEGEDSERAGQFSSHQQIGGKLGRTASITNTAREHLEDDLLLQNKPLFVGQNI